MNILIILAAKYLIVVPLAVAFYYTWKTQGETRRRYLLIGLFSLVISYILAKTGSYLYFDPRPFVSDGVVPLFAHAADNGFPSDHTLLASAIAAVITVFEKRSGLALWLVALAIGAARIIAGIHHPVDIIGSMLIAAAVTFAVTFFLSKQRSR